jgi:UDP-N-acetyl-D-mannosaminuronate dehydrogenase
VNKNNLKIGIFGLGYFGLSLAAEFRKIFLYDRLDISIDRSKK